MLNILHLLWIVPLAATLGFMFCSLLCINRIREDKHNNIFTKHSE